MFLMQTMARFEAAAGRPIDTEYLPTRKDALINELMLRHYGEREAKLAQEWILRGGPARFGSLTLADFYPTAEQLASVGVTVADEIAKAERRGYGIGYDAGWHAAEREIEKRKSEESSPLSNVLDENERVELLYLRGLTEALRHEFDKWRRDDAKAARVSEIKRKMSDKFNHGG